MKTVKKLMVLLIAAVTAFGSYLAVPLTRIVAKVSAATVADSVSVSVTNVPKELDLTKSSSVTIPTGTFSGDKNGVARVYNGAGRVVFDSSVNTDGEFKPQSAGKYTIVYGYTENDEFHRVSSDYVLTVVGTNPTLSLVENSEHFLPTKVPNKAGQVVKVPMPNIVLPNGDIIEPTSTEYPEVSVTVKNVSTSTGINLYDATGYKYFELGSDAVKGKYEVRYTYASAYKNAVLIKYFEVVDAANYDISNLKYTSTLSSWVESATRYKDEEITLPSVTVKDANGNDVTDQTYNKITVKYVEVTDGNSSDKTGADYFELNGNKLTLHKNAEKGGSHYEVHYEIKDYFGNKVQSYDFEITNVSTWRNKPTVFAVEGYATDAQSDTIKSMSHVIPSTFNFVADTNDVITIPAIYAEDVYGSEFTYTRTIRDTKGNTTNVDKDLKKDETNPYAYNEVATYKVSEEGKYVLTYTARSNKTKLSTTVTYNIYVKSAENAVTSAPEMKLPTIPATVKMGETVEFNIPTVNDYDKNNDVIDERVTITVSDNLTPVYEDHELVGYQFTGTTAGSNIITFTARNDNGEETTVTRLITVLESDNTAPTITVNTEYGVEDSVIMLPEITFSDTVNPEYTQVYVTVYDPNGNEISGINNITIDNKTHRVSGGSFMAGLTGEYRIVYTAIDAYNNTSSVVIITENIAGSSDYVQTGLEGAFPTQAEPGETITLPNAIIELNGEVRNDVSATIRVVSSAGAYSLTGANEFTARDEGQYTFVYVLNDEEISAHYTITVSDTQAPTLEVDINNIPDTVVGYDSDNVQPIYIPVFNPSDNVAIADYGITIEKNGSSFKEFTKQDLEKLYAEATEEIVSYSFEPNGDGVYTVEYYAVDKAGNEAESYTIEINVGDVDTPNIEFKASIPTTVDKGYKLTFNASDIIVTDSSNDTSYEVKLTNASGTSITNTGAENKYSFKLETAGTYTLTITADDGKGHKNTLTKTITVSSEEYDSKINTEVLGIILIVVSLLILGGVVFFFIKTRDRKPKIDNTKE